MLIWIIIGLISGSLASLITGRKSGCLTSIIVGMIGSVLGGAIIQFIYTKELAINPMEYRVLSLESIVVSTLGAIVLLSVVNFLTSRK